MGLDMYLNRMPRYKNLKVDKIMAIDGYYSWIEAKEKGNEYADCTLKEWCGASIDNISEEAIKFYEKFATVKYYYWDTEHKYGYNQIYESVGYWRKANAIHQWFVDNVQNGVDDCDYYEVSQEQLDNLLHICSLIKEQCRMKKSKIANGEHFENGQWVTDYIDGEYIENPEIAEEYLPTTSGFFFGGTEYDQWYMNKIEDTVKILTKVLQETDFKTQMIVYHSSW